MVERQRTPDPLTQASVTVAWVIFLNKPLYPVYIWWLVGNGVMASLATLISAPFFLAIPFLARYRPVMARTALPLVGTFDTLFETKLFGQPSGTELFFAACVMLAALSFRVEEKWRQRGVAVLVFLVFLLSRYSIGSPLHAWTDADLSIMLNLNAIAAGSLMVFTAFRFAGIPRMGV